ncbi:MAG: response regulator transcription factor [Burkholderiaceae bacterium]|nr:response regulator transcription factor [Burkholderiaceae bacterium]
MRVLVIEDNEGIAQGLRTTLRQQQMAVDIVSTIASAWSALQTEAFDIVLLDLGLPDGDGRELLHQLRTTPKKGLPNPATPVLILTAREEVTSRVTTLDAGADDYIIKPCNTEELAARIRALHRRSAGRVNSTIYCNELEIDTAARTVHRSGKAVELSAREFAVLIALVDSRPRVLSRTQIEAKLYNFDQILDSNAIEVHIHRLRRKLGDTVIRTMKGVGYFVPNDPSS